MALFHIARYAGPEAAGLGDTEAEAGSRARVLLERLQNRARERQQREPEVESTGTSAEAAGRRRRRPRRRRGVSGSVAQNPEAPRAKRQKTEDQKAENDVDAGRGEEAPGELSAGAEDPGASPQEDVQRPAAPGRVLGDFTRRKKTPKVQPFLPTWLAKPSCVKKSVTEDLTPIEDIPEVHPDLQKQLRANGISSYFPGSGKTLAFVIPVVQALLHRVVCHIRALVVLPTKELAQQVSKVFNIYTDTTPLRVALVTGQKSLAKEQESLVQKTADGFHCLADIVVATPGRLVDHIDQTPGFSLQQLRFLIIDEADRMIDSMHQSWLPRVVAAAFHSEDPTGSCALLERTQPQAVTAASTCVPQMPLQKLLFSATLTQNPEKLQRLGLYQPRLFSTRQGQQSPKDTVEMDENVGKYTFPVGLTHCYVPCRLSSKPLIVLHLVLGMNFSRALCFTNSRENSHRLFLLAQAFGGVSVAEFSSRYGPGQRKKILKQFEQGKIQLLISTDATARGIDVHGVELVINYDAPQYLRTYVHRVGRTARAGKTGQAFTLLLKVQERKFLHMVSEAGVPELARHEIPRKLLQPLAARYETALSQLEKTVKEEQKLKAA
ncbi:ATP-dependent RNA helicase DDX51 isoform X2 [Arvicanthis niloticus]|uniref:ATP-dependent RNA helicase DDX51 isoform X2 n=1 Tax=Arvicanthis niloticus TaxID=61156 RepID=UPI001486C600|nr:ATP-dependent RNA helicase DDX51 isoform X1 [Arvicanthis niloticus]